MTLVMVNMRGFYLIFIILNGWTPAFNQVSVGERPLPVTSRLRQRIMERLPQKQICYDMVGCFEVPRKRSLKKSPQSPQAVDTRFLLYTRQQIEPLDLPAQRPGTPEPITPEQLVLFRNASQLLRYDDDGESMQQSLFDPNKPVKVLIHGFKGTGKNRGALSGAQAFLALEDVNVLIVDWEKGAADSYPTAAANTELIGRQTAVMILEMLKLGAKAKEVHIIGFSLGAHIAGCAGAMLKTHGYTLGRITGLDPASPLFKHQFVRESATKLDTSDAEFVDVIHTDGSPVFTDGFGLLRPIGHVDFFPNGGREQPGCNDGRGSVVVSTIEGTINSSVACSHVRAWELFLESTINLHQENGCQFVGYPCSGSGNRFGEGRCFVAEPVDRCLPGDTRCNVMGMGVHKNGARGVLYLGTRDTSPFCGQQLQAVAAISDHTRPTRGYLHMQVSDKDNRSFNFRFTDEINDNIVGKSVLTAISVAPLPSLSSALNCVLSFQSLEFQRNRPNVDIILEGLTIRSMQGDVWYSAGSVGRLQYIPQSSFSALRVNLTQFSPINR